MTVLAQIQGEHNVKCTPVLWEWLKKVMCLIDKQHSNVPIFIMFSCLTFQSMQSQWLDLMMLLHQMSQEVL